MAGAKAYEQHRGGKGGQFTLCWASGKRGYSSKGEARAANLRNGHRMRAYKCPQCKRWHMTKRGD